MKDDNSRIVQGFALLIILALTFSYFPLRQRFADSRGCLGMKVDFVNGEEPDTTYCGDDRIVVGFGIQEFYIFPAEFGTDIYRANVGQLVCNQVGTNFNCGDDLTFTITDLKGNPLPSMSDNPLTVWDYSNIYDDDYYWDMDYSGIGNYPEACESIDPQGVEVANKFSVYFKGGESFTITVQNWGEFATIELEPTKLMGKPKFIEAFHGFRLEYGDTLTLFREDTLIGHDILFCGVLYHTMAKG